MMLSRDTRMSDLTGLLKVENSYTTSGNLVFRKGEEYFFQCLLLCVHLIGLRTAQIICVYL